MKRKALGKGLSSLIPEAPPQKIRKKSRVPESGVESVLEVDLDRILPNSRQPRQDFDADGIQELARSLKNNGVIQPVVVRRAQDGVYELIAGERRWRAAQQAGLLKIPAVLRDVPDDRLLEVALVENLQREELNPIEEAQAYQTLIDELGLTQQEVAERVGKQRATVTNMLRLLNLPKAVQDRVRSGKVSMGHARALIGLSSPKHQAEVAERVEREGLSVRQVEALVARASRESAAGPSTSGKAASRRDPNVEAAEESLQRVLGTKVRIFQNRKGSGRLEIHFYSDEELQRVYEAVHAAGRDSAR